VGNHIVTRRLLMVQLGVEEAVALVDGRGGNDRPWAPGYPDDGALMAAGFVMTAAQHGRDLGPYGTYEIIRRSDGAVIGAAGFQGQPDDTGSVRVGYGIAESARGHGYATEALRALLQWARGQDGLTAVMPTRPGPTSPPRRSWSARAWSASARTASSSTTWPKCHECHLDVGMRHRDDIRAAPG
jgi:GNAT superfamily N-acetyltransferase